MSGPISLTVRQPDRAIATSNSSRSISKTWATPSAPADSQTPHDGASDHHGLGSQPDRLQHIGAAPDPAVHQYRGSALDRIHDLDQRVQGRRRPVKLSPAVIGDHDAVDPMIHRDSGVLRRKDALDQERHWSDIADPCQIIP
jgi:hypothetical protein